MAPREKARNRSAKPLIEEYALLIDGAPLTCRWQELKDFIREYAPHSRQAEMYEDENGKPTGRGSVIVTRRDEAQRAYRALSRKGWDGHCIKVALAKRVNGGALDTIEGPTMSPTLPNPANYTNTSRLSTVSPPLSPKSDRYPRYSSAVEPHTAYYATAGSYQPQLPLPQIADGPNIMTMPYSTVAVSPSYAQYQDTHYVNANTAPQYQQNVVYSTTALAYTNGRHVTAPNISRHTASRPQASRASDAPIVSPNRTVFLTKLPYSAVGQAVRRLLEVYGRVERCDVPVDKTSPNKIQGTAIAKFKETNDASRAIKALNGYKWKGVTISARWDRDSASTNPNGVLSTSGRPVPPRYSSSGIARVVDARKDDSGPRNQQKRPGQGPLIVNGSRGVIALSRNRRGSKEDGSDSSEDDEDDRDDSSDDEDA